MGILVRLVVTIGLAIDAYVHITVADEYASVGDVLSMGELFLIQGTVAGVAALLALAWPGRWVYALAFLVAASAFVPAVLYSIVDVGAIGPLPNMYEPVWPWDKLVSAIGEAAAMIAALAGVVQTFWSPRPRPRRAAAR